MRILKAFALALAAVTMISCGNNSGRTIYVNTQTTNNDLVNLLGKERFKIISGESVSKTLEIAKPGSAVILTSANYPDKPQNLTESDLNTIKEKELRVFAEFVTLPGQNPDELSEDSQHNQGKRAESLR